MTKAFFKTFYLAFFSIFITKEVSAFTSLKIKSVFRSSKKLDLLQDFHYDSRRESRAAIGALSFCGGIETGYLTWSKLNDATLFSNLCNEQSCNSVLSGPFATIPYLNIPLTAIGALAYSAIFVLAVIPLIVKNDDKPSSNELEKSSMALVSISSIMATFSIYLLGLLTFVLHQSCKFCFLSAALSLSIFSIAWISRLVPDATKAFIISSTSAATTALGAIFLFYSTTALYPDAADASTAPAYQALQAMEKEEREKPKSPPAVTTVSSDRTLALAKRIENVEGKMYGAYWCSHCYNQKKELGLEATKYFQYIECDKEGTNSQNDLCRLKKIPGYPTWELNNEFYPGEKSIEELEKLMTFIESKSKR